MHKNKPIKSHKYAPISRLSVDECLMVGRWWKTRQRWWKKVERLVVFLGSRMVFWDEWMCVGVNGRISVVNNTLGFSQRLIICVLGS